MMQVLQLIGPVEAAPGSYDWITVGRIDEPEMKIMLTDCFEKEVK